VAAPVGYAQSNAPSYARGPSVAAPVGYAQPAGRTLSPQIVRTPPLRGTLDENPFARRPRKGRWAAFVIIVALVGGAGALAKFRPQALPPAVAQPVGRWVAEPASRWVTHLRSAVQAYLAPTPRGQSLEVASAASPAPPPVAASPARMAPASAAAVTTVSSSTAAGDLPVVDVSALPLAHADSATAPKVTVHPPPVTPARTVVPAQAPHPAPTPRPAPVAAADAPPKAAPAPPPPVNTAPAPAPGSLDDLIRKAVEADSKKKH
jgi:hypothetical protein